MNKDQKMFEEKFEKMSEVEQLTESLSVDQQIGKDGWSGIDFDEIDELLDGIAEVFHDWAKLPASQESKSDVKLLKKDLEKAIIKRVKGLL